MLIRTRITLAIGLVLVILSAALVGVAWQQGQFSSQRYATVAISGQTALWNTVIETEADRLRPLLGLLNGAAQNALTGDSDAIADEATSLIAARRLTDVQVVTEDGRVVYAASIEAEPARILDIATLNAVLEGASPAGLRQVGATQYLVVAASAIIAPDGQRGILTIGTPTDSLVTRFANRIGADAYLVTLREQLAIGTDLGLWDALDPQVQVRSPNVAEVSTGGRRYTLTGMPIPDISLGQAGLLVTLRDATALLKEARQLSLYAFAGVVAALLLVLTSLYLYLRGVFRPLEEALTALSALAKGDKTVFLPPGGNDEIGRIARAIDTFRQRLSDLAEAQQQREVLRRRQERFIRRRMAALAETLDQEAKQAINADLKAIMAGDSPVAAEAAGLEPALRQDDQLGPLAAVMNSMSNRVIDQNERLRDLIARLQEALIRETRLASLEQELSIARELQRSILPVDFPETPSHVLSADMIPAKEVGGDFYDFFDLPDGRLGLVMADVSGKGIPAAFFMAVTRTLLKSIAQFEDSAAVVIERLNTLLAKDNPQMMFATCFYGVVDLSTGLMTYVNAGHNPPVLIGTDGRSAMVEGPHGMALGVVEGMPYEEGELAIPVGATLILYTDGVTEGMNEAGEAFGDDKLLETLNWLGKGRFQDLVPGVVQAVSRHEDSAPQADDITVMALKRLG